MYSIANYQRVARFGQSRNVTSDLHGYTDVACLRNVITACYATLTSIEHNAHTASAQSDPKDLAGFDGDRTGIGRAHLNPALIATTTAYVTDHTLANAYICCWRINRNWSVDIDTVVPGTPNLDAFKHHVS